MEANLYNHLRQQQTPKVFERGGYKGYSYEIVSYGTHPCAYVEIPRNHRLFNIRYVDIKGDIDVHGGITYSGDKYENLSWWIGWDYAHIGDFMSFERYGQVGKQWQLSEIRDEVFNVINQLKLMELSDLVMFQKALIDQQRLKIRKLENPTIDIKVEFLDKDKIKESSAKFPQSILFKDEARRTFSNKDFERLKHFVIACNPRRINRLGEYLVVCNDISPEEFLGKDLLEKVYKFYEKTDGVKTNE